MSNNDLQSQIMRSYWLDVQVHVEKGQVFGVSNTVDLVQVGDAIAADQAQQVEFWLEKQQLYRISNPQQYSTDELVQILIVQPFVLVQEINDREG